MLINCQQLRLLRLINKNNGNTSKEFVTTFYIRISAFLLQQNGGKI